MNCVCNRKEKCERCEKTCVHCNGIKLYTKPYCTKECNVCCYDFMCEGCRLCCCESCTITCIHCNERFCLTCIETWIGFTKQWCSSCDIMLYQK